MLAKSFTKINFKQRINKCTPPSTQATKNWIHPERMMPMKNLILNSENKRRFNNDRNKNNLRDTGKP